MRNIKVDFVKTEYHFSKPNTYSSIKFEEEYDSLMLPQKGSLVVIGDETYNVEQLAYFPFGDKKGDIGVMVFLSEI